MDGGWKAPSTNKLAGSMKEYENLMYLKVKDSRHMVPMDVPSVALGMMRALIYEKSFDDYEQHIASQGKGDKSDDDHGNNCFVCPASSDDDDDADDDDGACHKCPTCPNAGPNSKNPEDREELAEKSPTVLVGVGVLTTWLVTLCTNLVRAKRSKGTPVQQYDIEMTGGSGYTDQLDLEDEEDKDIVFS
jgi:hypothetical protein